MEHQIYTEIDGSHTFVKKIIMSYYKHIPKEDQENFNNIRVYNTPKEPLFNGIDVYYCLKKTKKKIERMYDDLLDDEVLRQRKVESINRPINLITEYGLIHACYLYKNDISSIFQKFMREVIKQLKETGTATMVEAHKQLGKQLELERERRRHAELINKQNIEITDAFYNSDNHEQNKLELNILRRKTMNKFYVYLVDWKFVNSKYWKKYPKTEDEFLSSSKKIKYLEYEPTIVEGIDLNSSDDEIDIKKEPPKIRKKQKIDLSEPHIESINEYEFLYMDLADLKSDDNTQYYICVNDKEISANKDSYKFIRYLYLDKGVTGPHYKTMIEILKYGETYINKSAYPEIIKVEDEKQNLTIYKNDIALESSETPVRRTYKITYTELMNARDRGFINNNLDIIKDIKKEKRN